MNISDKKVAAVLPVVAILLFSGCSGGDASGVSGEAPPTSTSAGRLAVTEGATGLVTDEALAVTTWDVNALRSDAPRDLENAFERRWEAIAHKT